MTRIEIADVSVSLSGKRVLGPLSADFSDGGLIGLIGPNGAGKSTLLRALARLLPTDYGAIRLAGRPLETYCADALARMLAFLPQGQEVHWPLDVEALVRLGRLPHRRSGNREDAGAIARALTAVDAAHLAGRPVPSLSGGERARVLLARALASETPCLLVDEPVTSLDPYHQLQVMEMLRAVAEGGRLVIAVLHDLPLAMRFCHRLVLLSQGRLIAEGAPGEVLNAGNLEAAYRIAGLESGPPGERVVLPWRRIDTLADRFADGRTSA